MRLLWQHWSFDPFLVGVLAVAAVHALGLHRLHGRARPDRLRQLRRRAVPFYLGLLLLVVAVQSPVDYWSDSYFWVHMLQHLLLMFAAPACIVMGAPWLPLAFGLPPRLRRRLTLVAVRSRWLAPARAVVRWLRRPWVAVGAMNVVMLGWHLPYLFDVAERNQAVHIWAMHASMFAAGLLFWVQLVPSPPLRLRLSPVGRIEAVAITNVAMWLIAMTLGVFADGSWYSVYRHVPGVTLPALADQQIGAGILWVCGDFWAIPVVFHAVLELLGRRPAVTRATEVLIPLSVPGRWTVAVATRGVPRR